MVSTDQQDHPYPIPISIDDRVFFGIVDFSHGAGWYNIPLDIPFYYDGLHNICIYVDVTVPSDVEMNFHCIPTSSNQASTGNSYYQKNNLMFTKTQSASICTNLSAITRYYSADLSWNGVQGAQSYTVRYQSVEAMGTPVFTEGFENGLDNWTLRDAYSTTGIKAQAHSGSYCFAFEGNWDMSTPQYLISPQLSNLSEGSMLEFYYSVSHRDTNLSMDVGISVTDNQISSFNWVSTLGTNSEDWIRYFETIPAETKYICFRCTNETTRDLRIDDFCVRDPAEWQTATTVQTNLQLTGLSAVTEYKAQVRSNLPDELWSHTTRFTTQSAPTDLQCTSVGVTSATLGWTDDYTPEVWQICIDGDEGNLIEVTEKPYTLTDLTTMTTYTAKVRGRAGTEFSEWSNEIVVNTAQEPVSLPYSTGFETASDWYLINGDCTNAWTWGEAAHNGDGTHGLYISNDGGTTHAYQSSYSAVFAVKSFNFEAAGIYKFTFDWMANGDRYNDFMRVVLIPADQNIVAGSLPDYLPSSWIAVGGIDELYNYPGLYYSSTEWQTANCEVPVSTPGTYNLVFIWKNSYATASNPPAAIDNLSVALCECPKPTKLVANVVEGTNTAELSWTETGEATAWQVCLNDDEDNLIDVTTNPCTLTGLTCETWYTAKVRANCGDSQSDWSYAAIFESTQKIHIKSKYAYNPKTLPFRNANNYSLTQQIYTAEEFGDAGLITCIDFQKTSDVECVRNLDIYMVHTDKTSFESTDDWIPVTDADLVFSGTVEFIFKDWGNLVKSWTSITLDTPFNYDGQHNVALIVDDNTGSHSGTAEFAGYYTSYSNSDLNRSILYNDNDTNSDPKGTPQDADELSRSRNQLRILKVVDFSTEITGYGSGNGNWHLVASPLAGTISPVESTNMISNTYDLYRFNHSAAAEWENWKQVGDHYHFNLESGRGYLYANSEDVTLVFSGVPYSGNGQVTLSKDNTRLGQWNLIGNPLSTNATLGTKPFYIMNDGGTEIIAADSEHSVIAPMQGVFVEANSDGEIVTFTAQARGGESANESIVLNLSQGSPSTSSGTAAIDRVIVRFGEGEALHKLQIREGNPKVYIPQDGKEYAIVSIGGRDGVHTVSTNEIPVNFKAAQNGTYTLTINPEGVEMAYLHLIDNMTGADVDLLPLCKGGRGDYTFTAKTTDYASRFRLVFSICGDANGDNDGDNETPFAFVSNDNIVITADTQNATLQIVDAMGRMVVCTDVAHTVSTSGMTAGVYVLRLIDGDNVRTQKIVIQ